MNLNTIYFYGALLDVLLALLMGFAYLNLRTHAGFGSWLLSIAALAASLVCLWIYLTVNDIALILVSNILQTASVCLALHGTGRFVGHPVSPWLTWGCTAGGSLASAVLTLWSDDRALRIASVAFFIAVPLIAQIRLAYRTPAEPATRAMLRLLIFSNGTFLALILLRAGYYFVAKDSGSVRPQGLQEFTYLVVCGTQVGYFFSYLALSFARTLEEQKAAEASMADSEGRFRRIMESDMLGMFFARDSGEIIQANDAFLRLLGYSRDDVRAGRLNWRGLTPPEFSQRDQEAVEEMAARGSCRPFEKAYLHRDGRRVPILLGAAAFADSTDAGVAFVLDLSERKNAEEALRASEERFRDLVETTDAIVWEADANTFSFTSVSANVERLLGYSRSDWLQPGFWKDHVHPDDRERVVSFCVASTSRGENHTFDYRFLTKDGRTVWLHDEVKVILEDGKPRWLRGLIVDITEWKWAEAELHQMRFSVDHAGDSIFWVSRAGRILYANEAACKGRGYTRTEMLALNIFDLDPDYQSGVWGPHFEEMKRVGNKTFETIHRTKDGRIIPIEVTSSYVSLEGEEFLFATVRDITLRRNLEQERQQSLSLMSSTIESTADGMMVVNTAGTIEIFNQNFARMWRLPEPVIATRNYRLVVGYVLEQLRDPDHYLERIAYLQENPAVESFDVIEFNDGRVFERYSRPQWVGEKVVGRALSFRDTTARRQAEAERAKLEAQLHHSQKLEAVGTLAGGIAHDFNNILSGIYGYLGLAQAAAAAAEQPELQGYLEEIRHAGQRAADLVRQILAFSRAQSTDQLKSSLALDKLVHEAVSLLRAASPTVIEIVTQIAENPPAVCGNASQLHQVIMNLGTNALHAMRDRAGRLSIELEVCTISEDQARTLPGLTAGPCLRLGVQDTGAGMDPLIQARVFEPFFTTKGPGEGTGLGLSVVHGIIRDHQGAIRLSSEVGKGTLFEVFLPAESAVAAAPAAESAIVQRGQGERILMVDDEVAITLTGQRALQKLGYRVETENSALGALARLERDPQAFELVLTDQSMPDMTGLEFAARLRDRRADLPVVLASGNSVPLTPERTEAAGVREVLAKPYTIPELVEVVRRQLELGRKASANGGAD